MLGLQQTGFRPLGVLVENICDVLVTAEGLWSYGSHEVCENELERELDLVVGGFGMSQLVTLCLLYTSPSPRDKRQSRMPSSA